MNIFFLATNPTECAQYYLDKHCIKIILEIAQMLYGAHHWAGNATWLDEHRAALDCEPYRKTHLNHPMSRWVRQTPENYQFAAALGRALCTEYTRRYNKVHKTATRLEWLSRNEPPVFQTAKISAVLARAGGPPNCTPIPLAMPAEYHTDDAVESYRRYYHGEKMRLAGAREHAVPCPIQSK